MTKSEKQSLENIESNAMHMETHKNRYRKMNARKHNKNFVSSINCLQAGYKHQSIPDHFREIFDVFVSLDVVVNKMINGRETLYFDKIASVFKQMSDKDFNQIVLGQILTVFPESYSYTFKRTQTKSLYYFEDKLQLIPNLLYASQSDSSPRKSKKCFSLGQLQSRRKCFRERLVSLSECGPQCAVKGSLHTIPSCSFDRPTSIVSSDSQVLRTPPTHLCQDLFGRAGVAVKRQINDEVDEKKKRVLQVAPTMTKSIQNDKHSLKRTTSYKQQRHRLPVHLRVLFELFLGLEQVVRASYIKGELCFVGDIAKSISSTCTFSAENHLSKLMALYQGAYSVRWERVRPPHHLQKHRTCHLTPGSGTSKYDIVIKPDLRADGTAAALASPSKGFLQFDFLRLEQRRQMFLRKCDEFVLTSYEAFMTRRELTPSPCDIDDKHSAYERKFDIDRDVKSVTPVSLPQQPVSRELTSITQFFSILKRLNADTATEMQCDRSAADKEVNLLDTVDLQKIQVAQQSHRPLDQHLQMRTAELSPIE